LIDAALVRLGPIVIIALYRSRRARSERHLLGSVSAIKARSAASRLDRLSAYHSASLMSGNGGRLSASPLLLLLAPQMLRLALQAIPHAMPATTRARREHVASHHRNFVVLAKMDAIVMNRVGAGHRRPVTGSISHDDSPLVVFGLRGGYAAGSGYKLSPTGSLEPMETIRACYVASRVFCPMVAAERDGNSCLGCSFFAGILTEGERLAFACSWSPRDSESEDTESIRLAA
jgi:hypothetical protein